MGKCSYSLSNDHHMKCRKDSYAVTSKHHVQQAKFSGPRLLFSRIQLRHSRQTNERFNAHMSFLLPLFAALFYYSLLTVAIPSARGGAGDSTNVKISNSVTTTSPSLTTSSHP